MIGALQEREDALAAVQLLQDELVTRRAALGKSAALLGPAAAGDKRHMAQLAAVQTLQVSTAAKESHDAATAPTP